jgi:hypothetical protein
MTIATNNGVPIIRSGSIVTTCACCGWSCYAPDAGACLSQGETGWSCRVAQQCECDAESGEVFLGQGVSCNCGCGDGATIPAALRIRSLSVQDRVIENADIAQSSRAALQAIDFTAPLVANSVVAGGFGYYACLFDNAAGWDVWLFYEATTCQASAKSLRLLLEIAKGGQLVVDGGRATLFDFNSRTSGLANLEVPCISANQSFLLPTVVEVTPVGFSYGFACNTLQNEDRRWYYEATQNGRIGRRNSFDVSLEFTWIATNPLP